MVKIERATAEDAPWIKEIYKEAKKELGSFNLYQCWDFYINNKPNRDTFSVIRKIGFVRWKKSKKYGRYLIQDIAVKKEYKGMGYGKLLLQMVPVPVMLKCNEGNQVGNTFYKAVGMSCEGKTFTKSGKPQLIWTRTTKW